MFDDLASLYNRL